MASTWCLGLCDGEGEELHVNKASCCCWQQREKTEVFHLALNLAVILLLCVPPSYQPLITSPSSPFFSHVSNPKSGYHQVSWRPAVPHPLQNYPLLFFIPCLCFGIPYHFYQCLPDYLLSRDLIVFSFLLLYAPVRSPFSLQWFPYLLHDLVR